MYVKQEAKDFEIVELDTAIFPKSHSQKSNLSMGSLFPACKENMYIFYSSRSAAFPPPSMALLVAHRAWSILKMSLAF